MENEKTFKKPLLPLRKIGKENAPMKENTKGPRVQTPLPQQSANARMARGDSVSSEDYGKAYKNKQTIDVFEWESKTKNAIREFCTRNKIDLATLYLDEKKKSAAGQKVSSVGRAQATNVTSKLLPIFKTLEKLTVENRFPPEDVLALFKPLGESFFAKKSAFYWHIFAKAAVGAKDYSLALELLDRGTKCQAEPIMEMLRAYSFVSHQLLNAFRRINDSSEEEGDDEAEEENTTPAEPNVNETRESEDASNNDQAVAGNNAVENNVDHDNTETEGAVETAADGETKPKGEDSSATPREQSEDEENEVQSPPRSPQQQQQQQQPDDPHMEEIGACAEDDNDAFQNETYQLEPEILVTTENLLTANDSSHDQPATDTTPIADADPSRRKTPRSSEVDPTAVFKSSTKKLLVVPTKSGKKRNGASETVQYEVTPVRRSTRKTGGYDKWNTYRTTTVDSPSEFQQLGINNENAEFKDNPFLDLESDSDQ